MELLYTDNRIVVCLKPAGVLSTDEPDGMPELLRRALGEDETGCVRVVHRLDRPVGGVMVYARSRMADSILSRQVQAHTFEKDYLAVLEGIPDAPEGVLADLLTRDAAKKQTFVTHTPGPDARPARLSYRVLGVKDGRALVRIRLETGRTHQIRVHLSHEGHPLVGDIKYGDRRVNGMAKNKLGITTQLLHAYQLKFSGLEGNFAYLNGKTVKAKLPEEFQEALQKLGFTDKDLEAFA